VLLLRAMINRYTPYTNFILFLLLPLLWWPSPQAKNPSLELLTVQLWPEYDRPETLVIYQGQLTADTELPIQLTFLLPDHVSGVHAVAYAENNALLQVPDSEIEFIEGNNERKLLSFSVPSHSFHFEYYDSAILTIADEERTLSYRFGSPLDAEKIVIELQQPHLAENFQLTPAANRTLNDEQGLAYHRVEIPGLKLGEAFNVEATYSRPTMDFSIDTIQTTVSQAPPTQNNPPIMPTEPTTTSPSTNTLGYVLISVGFLVLVGSGGYWWWSSQQPKKQYTRAKSHPITATTPQLSHSPSPAGFCHQCGTALRLGAEFCHACGTPRRK